MGNARCRSNPVANRTKPFSEIAPSSGCAVPDSYRIDDHANRLRREHLFNGDHAKGSSDRCSFNRTVAFSIDSANVGRGCTFESSAPVAFEVRAHSTGLRRLTNASAFEPAGYLSKLAQVEPEVAFYPAKLKTESDWIEAGREVFRYPI